MQADVKFASTDARHKYGGKGLPVKGGAKVKANFNTPMSSKSTNKVVTSCSDSGKSVKGEKSKEKVVHGAVGGGGDGDSSDGQCVRQQLTKEKLDGFCRHLGDGRGECVVCVIVSVVIVVQVLIAVGFVRGGVVPL